jgi:putative spermidine/putrescine transport system permease protein
MTLTHPSRTSPRARIPDRRVSVGVRRGLLLVPVVALVAVSFAWPVLSVLLRSLAPDGRVNWTSPAITTEHYQRVFTDATLQGIMIHTFVIAFWTTLITTALAFPVAYLISRLPRRRGAVLLIVVLLQFWVSILVRLFAYTQILGREGVINRIADSVGAGPFDLLFNTTATVIGMVVYLLPYMVLILYAGMSGIDHGLVTAARTLGASGRQAFWRVYAPLVRPTVITGASLVPVSVTVTVWVSKAP